jgi:hypothetical protein
MPLTGVSVLCGARRRDGGECTQVAMANGRCKMHGGKTPTGPALPQFKTGRYSKVLPAALLDRYQQALADPELLALTDEIALLDARLGAVVTRPASTEAWAEIVSLVEQRRRLVESERKRLVDLQQTMTAGEAVVLAMQLLDVVRRNVTDRTALAAIGREFESLLHRPDRPRLTAPTA